VAAAYLRNDAPWRRLAWELPAALVLLFLSLAGFLHLLAEPGALPAPAAPTPVEVEVVDLPPLPSPAPLSEPQPAAMAERTLPPPTDATEPPPPPDTTEPPPPDMAEPPPRPPQPVAVAQPEPPPPKPPPPRSRPTAPPQTAALPPAAAPTTPPPPSAPTGASPTGTTGARALFKPMPEIPEALRHHALNFTALARFQVAASGAAEVELVEPTPDPTLNQALLDALKKWRFFPAVANGKAVASTIDIRIPITVR
jgi:protein TonB